MNRIITVTGHRPDKLGGYSPENFDRLVGFATLALEWHSPAPAREVTVYTGLALGWDQASAVAAKRMGFKVVGYAPCEAQDTNWPAQSREQYHEICKGLDDLKIVFPGLYPGPWVMQNRNRSMVDDMMLHNNGPLLALWDGSTGGTANCVEYAQKRNVEIVQLWEQWLGHLAMKAG